LPERWIMADVCLTDELRDILGFDRRGNFTDEEIAMRMNTYTKLIAQQKRTSKMQALAVHRNVETMNHYVNESGVADPQRGFESAIYRDRREMPRIARDHIYSYERDENGVIVKNANGEKIVAKDQNGDPVILVRADSSIGADLDSTIHGIRASYQGKVIDMLEEMRTKYAGLLDNKKGSDMLVRALYGDVRDAAFTKMAADWKKLHTELRERFNRAGGDIDELKDWSLPRTQDSTLVKKHGEADWIDMVKRTADMDRMRRSHVKSENKVPTQQELDAVDIDDVLSKMYKNIISEGVTEAPFENVGKISTKIADRHKERRSIHFKEADQWMEYHGKYSNTAPVNAMMDYVSMLSNEIGMMEKFGPNPTTTVNTMAAQVKRMKGDVNAADVGLNAYAEISGQLNPHHKGLSDSMEAIRNFTSAVKLPGAVLSAPPDLLMNAIAANYNGFSGFRMIMDAVAMLGKANTRASRKLAADLGMQLDFMIDSAHAASRFSDVTNRGHMAKLAGVTVRGGFLNHWTVANKMAFHFGFMRELGDLTPSKGPNKNMKLAFERYGIDSEMISEIQNSTRLIRDGKKFLDPQKLKPETAEAVGAMVAAETKLAVPEGDVRVKGFLNQGTQRGTAGGEALRMGTMFKTFLTSIIMNNWARLAYGRSYNGQSRAMAMLTMGIGTTMLGAASVQMKEIAKGNDPLPWDNNEFWKDAALQGGMMSILGDVLSEDQRNFGTAADFMGGPALGVLNDIFWRGVLGSYDDAKNGDLEMEQLFKDSAAGVANNIPPLKLWYVKAAMDSMMLDAVNQWADPKYKSKRRKRNIKKRREYNREKW
jgi:hypothetical protein